MQKSNRYDKYKQQFDDILQNSNYDNNNLHYHNFNKIITDKVVFMKQMIDVSHDEELDPEEAMGNFYVLRNVKFLRKLRRHLNELQEESAREMREVKIYELCRQFHRDTRNEQKLLERSIFTHIKLAPLAEHLLIQSARARNDSIVLNSAQNATRVPFESLEQFGALLYERINPVGSEIVDDYLSTIRKLLIEVIDDKPDIVRQSDKLAKVLIEIDAIMAISDFAQKRTRLYEYLETNLSEDFEQFKNSEHSLQDFAEIMLRLKRRGLDLFVTFLFTNFELLERTFAEWAKLLNSMEGDNPCRQLHELREIHTFYEEFKMDHDDQPKKYEIYITSLKNLYDRTKAMNKPSLKVFEILHHASNNVGSVTLNMIKAKCDEI